MTMRREFGLLTFLAGVTVLAFAIGGRDDNPDLKTPQKSLDRFRSLKVGAFIHWGPSSQTGQEISWSRGVGVPREKYDNLYKTFNPVGFNADEWVRLFKAAGFRYIVYVPKHHDGFCMWNTGTTDHNVMNTPFRRDVTKELSAACKRQGMTFCLYYSIADFYNPDYPHPAYPWGPGDGNYGGAGYRLPAGQMPDFDRYVLYMKTQLRELSQNYGPILAWWFDANWSPYWTHARGSDLYAYMRKLQPDVLMDNRVGGAYNGAVYEPTWFASERNEPGDYAVLETDMPRFNRDIPWEFTKPAKKIYSWCPGPSGDVGTWIDWIVKSACGDGNFNLGISATPHGEFEPELAAKLKLLGRWLERNGESIYDTRGGPYERTDWYGSTCRGNRVYLHVFKTERGALTLPPLPLKITSCHLINGAAVNVNQTQKNVRVTIREHDLQPTDTIVVLSLNGSAEQIKPIEERPVNQGAAVRASNVRQNKPHYAAEHASDGDMSTYWATDDGVKDAYLEYDLGRERTFSRAILFEGEEEAQLARIRHIQIQVKLDGEWKTVSDDLPGGNGEPWPLSVMHPEIRFTPVTARFVRLQILGSTGSPVIHEFKLFER
jgi:alpha-L-fucosidase